MDFSFSVHRFLKENLRKFISQMGTALWVYEILYMVKKVKNLIKKWRISPATVHRFQNHKILFNREIELVVLNTINPLTSTKSAPTL